MNTTTIAIELHVKICLHFFAGLINGPESLRDETLDNAPLARKCFGIIFCDASRFLAQFIETRISKDEQTRSSSSEPSSSHLQMLLQEDGSSNGNNDSRGDASCMEALHNLILITSYACTASNKNSSKFRESFANSPGSIFSRLDELELEDKSSLQYPLRPGRVVVYDFCTKWKQPIWTKDALIGLSLHWAILCLLLSNKTAGELDTVELLDSLRDADPKVRAMVQEAIGAESRQVDLRRYLRGRLSSDESLYSVDFSSVEDEDDDETDSLQEVATVNNLFEAVEWLLTKPRFFDQSVQLADDIVRNMSVSQAKHIENSTTYILFSHLKRALKTHLKNPLMWAVVVSTSAHTDLCHLIHTNVLASQQPSEFHLHTSEQCVQRQIHMAEERCCLLDLALVSKMIQRFPMVGLMSDTCNVWTPLVLVAAYRGPSVFNPNLQKHSPLSDGGYSLAMVHLFATFCPSAACIADRNGLLPLHHAARKGHSVVMQYLLRAFPHTASIPDATSKFALHHALLSASQHDEVHLVELASIFPRILQAAYESHRGKVQHHEQSFVSGGFNIFAYLEKHCSTSMCFALKQFVRDDSSAAKRASLVVPQYHNPQANEIGNAMLLAYPVVQVPTRSNSTDGRGDIVASSRASKLNSIDIRPAVESLLMLFCSAGSQRESRPAVGGLAGTKNKAPASQPVSDPLLAKRQKIGVSVEDRVGFQYHNLLHN